MTVQPHTAPTSSSKLLMTQRDRPDHRQRWDGLQRGGEHPDKMVSGEPPLTQHRQDQGAGGGFQETEHRTHTHHHPQDPVERVNSFKFLSVHITEDLTWSAHTDAVLKKAHQRSSSWEGWGSLERAPESSDPSTPALWRASWPAASPPGLETAPLQPQSSAKGRANCRPVGGELPSSRTSTHKARGSSRCLCISFFSRK